MRLPILGYTVSLKNICGGVFKPRGLIGLTNPAFFKFPRIPNIEIKIGKPESRKFLPKP